MRESAWEKGLDSPPMPRLERTRALLLDPKRIWLTSVWVLLALGGAILSLRSTTPLWPAAGLRIQTFDDRNQGGTSAAHLEIDSNEVELTLSLDSGATWPVAGAIFHLAPRGQVLDLSAPGNIRLEIGPSSLATLQTCLVEEIPGFTREDRWQTARYDCQSLDLVPGTSRYDLPLDRFLTPQWWFATSGVRPSQLGPETRQRVVRFVVQSGEGLRLGEPGNVRFSRMEVHSFHWGRSLSVLLMGAILSLVHFLLLRRVRSKGHASLGSAATPRNPVVFQPVEAVSYADREREAVVHQIATGFSDPEMSLESIARATGVPQERVTSHLKAASGLLFKPYLNRVRVEAARKLLLETDLPVSEIAGLVGYGNIPHFNRIFRELVGTTPSALREDPAKLVETSAGSDKTEETRQASLEGHFPKD